MQITGSDAHHIKQVLRMKPTEQLSIITGDHYLTEAVIETLTEEAITVRALHTPQKTVAVPKVILAQGLSKGEKMDLVVQKAVELGVTDIYPLALSRCVVSYDDKKAQLKCQRWQKIAAEAAKQSKHLLVPTVHPIGSLNDFLLHNTARLNILAYEEETQTTLKTVLRAANLDTDTAFIVGAEGGLTPQEAEAAKQYGFQSVSLGKQILRTETAPLMLLAALQYEKN